MTRKEGKTIHEAFARFFEAPNRETLRDLLKENLGELRNCDFKESWPEHAGLARHLLGLGNAGGGCLVFGVRENSDKSLSSVGLPQIKDKADVTNGTKAFLPESLLAAIEIADFKYEASEYPAIVGKLFQVLFVHPRPEGMPFISRRDGSGIRAAAIYVRREGMTEEATYEELQRLVAERLAASPQTAEARDLKEHLEELKVLFAEVPKRLYDSPTLGAWAQMDQLASFFGTRSKPNPDFPAEHYEAFVLRMIKSKKALIETLLGIAE